MNAKAKGELSQAKILTKLLEKGKQVAIPFGDNQRYDLVIVEGIKAIRVQCKTGWLKNGVIKFKVISHNPFTLKNRNYSDDADVFMIYCFELDKVYYMDVNEISKLKFTCSLRVDLTKNNQKLCVMWAKNYEY